MALSVAAEDLKYRLEQVHRVQDKIDRAQDTLYSLDGYKAITYGNESKSTAASDPVGQKRVEKEEQIQELETLKIEARGAVKQIIETLHLSEFEYDLFVQRFVNAKQYRELSILFDYSRETLSRAISEILNKQNVTYSHVPSHG